MVNVREHENCSNCRESGCVCWEFGAEDGTLFKHFTKIECAVCRTKTYFVGTRCDSEQCGERDCPLYIHFIWGDVRQIND